MKFKEESISIIKGDGKVRCSICGCPTEFIEICTESHFCSSECVNEFYKEYFRYLESVPDVE